MTTAWSYSAIKTFEQCPKKYFHLKVAKDYEDTPHESAIYGTEVHSAAEEYIKTGVEIPKKYNIIEPIVKQLEKIPGEKHAELKLGVAKKELSDGIQYEACDFFADHVWYRGIIDLLIVDGHRAYLIDYKTGKNAKYADARQLDLMAGAVFVHFPDVELIKAGLVYIVSGDLIEKNYAKWDKEKCLNVFSRVLDRLEAAKEVGVWNTKDGPLCGWCPVEECVHWRPRRGR